MARMWRVGLRARCAMGAGAFGAALTLSSTVQAAGVEDTVSGTVALGRAANYARVNDFMATWQNPANLAIARGNVGAELRLPIFNACFDRAKNNTTDDLDERDGPGISYKPSESFGEECNDATPLPAGNLGFSLPLVESPTFGRLALGAGVFTPAGVGSLSFGSDTVVSVFPAANEQLPLTTTGTQSGNRYLLLDRTVLAAFASVGLGWEPIRELRVGAMFGWGFADVKYRNVASLQQGFTDQEVVNDVRVRDLFIPRATASIAVTPRDALDLMASFTYTGDIEADGYVDITANGIQGAPRRDCRDADPGPHCRVDDVKLRVPFQRFEAVLGARYAERRTGRTATLDPLHDEVWDLELDGYYANTGHVNEYALDIYEFGVGATPQIKFSSDPDAFNSPLPQRAALPHGWRDTYGVRAGGDYNVLQDVLALRAGVSFETRGVPTKNMNIDYWPVQKVGAHVGVTWRVGIVDLHVAYAHLFNEEINVPVGKGNINEVTAVPGDKKLPVNEGRYTSSQDIVSLQANARF